ncbi:MAG TPA: AAA family ATPase [Gaiellaceae bacterium]
MPRPLLVVVSGPPGSGTTTLAHSLARAIPCPAVCRDEIKEGLVHGLADYRPAPGDAEAYRTLEIFFGVLGYLVNAGVSLIAEAAFQHALWEPGLRPLLDRANVRIVHCRADSAVVQERIDRRAAEVPGRRPIHGNSGLVEDFDQLRLPVPSLEVDTTDGYEPSLDEIVAFAKG